MQKFNIIKKIKLVALCTILMFSGIAKTETNLVTAVRLGYISLAAITLKKAYSKPNLNVVTAAAFLGAGIYFLEFILDEIEKNDINNAWNDLIKINTKYEKLFEINKQLLLVVDRDSNNDHTDSLLSFCQQIRNINRLELDQDLSKLKKAIETLVSHDKYTNSDDFIRACTNYSLLIDIKGNYFRPTIVKECLELLNIKEQYCQELANPDDFSNISMALVVKNQLHYKKPIDWQAYLLKLNQDCETAKNLVQDLQRSHNYQELNLKVDQLLEDLLRLKNTIEKSMLL